MAMEDKFLLSLLRWVDLGVVSKLVLLILFLMLIYITSRIHENYENVCDEFRRLIEEKELEALQWRSDYFQVQTKLYDMKARFARRVYQLEDQVAILASDKYNIEHDDELETKSERLPSASSLTLSLEGVRNGYNRYEECANTLIAILSETRESQLSNNSEEEMAMRES